MYTTDDGVTKINVTYDSESVWLSLNDIAELFQKDKSTISRHIKNVFEEGELEKEATVAKNATVQIEGDREIKRDIDFYNLDVAISVGYRVKSARGVQFRIWANSIIKEYMLKGFAMNDDLLKQAGGGNYFKELLGRIRDIRSSEKVFYRQVLDLFATSVDYDAKSKESGMLFASIQNKLHWATHGHTASELVVERANSNMPNMGMTNFKGASPSANEATIAKNYLNEKELNILNRLVSAYLDLAEIHAMREEQMKMRDWIVVIDDFLRMTRSDVLSNTGTVSRISADNKAKSEFDKYKKLKADSLSSVEKDFVDSIKGLHKQLEGKGNK